MDDARTWDLIHRERAATADTLAALTPAQWAQPSWCGDSTVQVTAAHIVTGAEQTPGHFFGRMAANGFRFNTMMDRDAHRLGERPITELVDRLRATTTTTNRPPAPVATMLGEIVVHGEDIRRPLGLEPETSPEAVLGCLALYEGSGFPVGGKKRIAGLGLVATDLDWSHGSGPEVSGPGLALVMAMTGRTRSLDALSGDGVDTLRDRAVALR
jgi:uncharacterized protein (TIGR03083 family)